MAKAIFITQVVFHTPETGETYERLDQAMEAEGFKRTIIGMLSGKPVEYHLPQAQYFREGELALQEVYDLAMRAASQTRREYAVLVTQAQNCMWEGLREVRSSQDSLK